MGWTYTSADFVSVDLEPKLAQLSKSIRIKLILTFKHYRLYNIWALEHYIGSFPTPFHF